MSVKSYQYNKCFVLDNCSFLANKELANNYRGKYNFILVVALLLDCVGWTLHLCISCL